MAEAAPAATSTSTAALLAVAGAAATCLLHGCGRAPPPPWKEAPLPLPPAGGSAAAPREEDLSAVSTVALQRELLRRQQITGEAVDELGHCPYDGLHAHRRCWYLSEDSATCASTCFSIGLNFSWAIATEGSPMVPLLLKREPVTRLPAWGRLECYSEDGDQLSPAQQLPAASTGDTAGSAKYWSAPSCRLACPCHAAAATVRRDAGAGGSGVCEECQVEVRRSEPLKCGLPRPLLTSCCVNELSLCWKGWPWYALRNHQRCCGADAIGECPAFGELVVLRRTAVGGGGQTAEVCLHRRSVEHDVVEHSLRKRRRPWECALMHRIVQFLLKRTRRVGRLQVLDVGANVGSCAVALAMLGADVTAIEPHPRTFALLNASAWRLAQRAATHHTADSGRPFGRLHALNLAASDHSKVGWLLEPMGHVSGSYVFFSSRPDSDFLAAANRLRVVAADGSSAHVRQWPVEVWPLDRLLPLRGVEHVDVMKIDTEGDELKVLRGARRLVRDSSRAPQVIKFEFHAGRLQARRTEPLDLLRLLLSRDYALLVLRTSSTVDLQGACGIFDEAGAVKFLAEFPNRYQSVTDFLAFSSAPFWAGFWEPLFDTLRMPFTLPTC